MIFLSDSLPTQIVDTLEKVERSETWIFSDLVGTAGLNPAIDLVASNLDGCDFRQSDLRGFNFDSCSMIGCLKDSTTKTDKSTIFPKNVSWLSENDIQMHEWMLRIQSSLNTNRKSDIKKLIEEFGANAPHSSVSSEFGS